MSIFDAISRKIKSLSDALVEWERDMHHASVERDASKVILKIQSESLTCNFCGSLAIPLFDSANKYKCGKCGRQFSQSSHDIAYRLCSMLSDGPTKVVSRHRAREIYDMAVSRILSKQ